MKITLFFLFLRHKSATVYDAVFDNDTVFDTNFFIQQYNNPSKVIVELSSSICLFLQFLQVPVRRK